MDNPIHSRGGALYSAPLLCAAQYPPLQCAVSTLLLVLAPMRTAPDHGAGDRLVCAIAAAAPAAPTILIVGDSISAGYGLPPDSGWVTLLQRRLTAQHYPQRVVNASISGDTTASGRARLDTLLAQQRPAITVIELGGNDGLRGGSLDAMRANLDAMVVTAQKAGSRVLLGRHAVAAELRSGVRAQLRRHICRSRQGAPRRAGAVPVRGFRRRQRTVPARRIHPVVAAQPRLLDNVWRELQPLLGPPGKGAMSTPHPRRAARRRRQRSPPIATGSTSAVPPSLRRITFRRRSNHPVLDDAERAAHRHTVRRRRLSRRAGVARRWSRAISPRCSRRRSSTTVETGGRWSIAGAAASAAGR